MGDSERDDDRDAPAEAPVQDLRAVETPAVGTAAGDAPDANTETGDTSDALTEVGDTPDVRTDADDTPDATGQADVTPELKGEADAGEDNVGAGDSVESSSETDVDAPAITTSGEDEQVAEPVETATPGPGGADATADGDGAAEAADEAADAPAALVRSAELKAIVEALIFASPEPLSLSAITKLLDGESKDDVNAAIAALRIDYERPGGLQLVEVAGGYQIVTRPDLNEWVRRLFHERSTQKLSVQALETLAVIAYRQPITAAEVAEIRGVNTSGVLNTLLERHLVKIVGRKAVVGRPFMYATTKEFLIRFGLNDINDLPKVQDMVDALGLESPLLVERMTAEEQLPLDEPDAENASADEPRG